VHALEKPSADTPIIGPETNTLNTANKKAIAERPINTIVSFAIVIPPFLIGKESIAQREYKTSPKWKTYNLGAVAERPLV
jgi:hypothetical protein